MNSSAHCGFLVGRLTGRAEVKYRVGEGARNKDQGPKEAENK